MPPIDSSPAEPPARATRLFAGLTMLLTLCIVTTVCVSRLVSPGPATADPARGRIDLNTATVAELDLLPRIGPALADRIVADRLANGPFRTVDDLDRVEGIGPKTLDRIRDHASVAPE